MSVTSANRLELLQIADAVAREKMIDPSLVIEAMEDASEGRALALRRRIRHPRQDRPQVGRARADPPPRTWSRRSRTTSPN